mgnify:CR=1 FL=1
MTLEEGTDAVMYAMSQRVGVYGFPASLHVITQALGALPPAVRECLQSTILRGVLANVPPEHSA